jgi:hypothetical protein
VVITRRWAVFLIAVGVWTWVIWPRFGLAIWDDDRSFSNVSPTAFLGVHAVLIAASLAFGTAVGVLGVKAWLATRRGPGPASTGTEEITVGHAAAPKD